VQKMIVFHPMRTSKTPSARGYVNGCKFFWCA